MLFAHSLCPACRDGRLSADEVSSDELVADAVRCTNCSWRGDMIWGVPYLGTFTAAELPSIIETTSLSSRTAFDAHGVPLAANEDRLRTLEFVEQFVTAADPTSVLKAFGYVSEPHWLGARCVEHMTFSYIMQGLDLAGRRVLDIGAGTGFDSLRFARGGADVVSLEYSPLQAALGARMHPQMHWCGGGSHCLPFADESFDFVIANAALHHILDLPTSILEMLRVLKPGGWFLSMADSFGPANFSERDEVAVFNDHPAVLNGVNEQIPPVSNFFAPLQAHRTALDVRVFTNIVHGLERNLREWSFDDAQKTLVSYRGGIATRVYKRESLNIKAAILAHSAIRPSALAALLHDKTSAMARFAEIVQPPRVDLPLLSDQQAKFRLLTGWKSCLPGATRRTAVASAFHYFEHVAGASAHVQLTVPYIADEAQVQLRIFIAAACVLDVEIVRGQRYHLIAPIPDVDLAGATLCMEIALATTSQMARASEFFVYELTTANTAAVSDSVSGLGLDTYGLSTLCLGAYFGHDAPICIVSPDYRETLRLLARLRALIKTPRIIAPEYQRFMYEALVPDIELSGVYRDDAIEWLSPAVHNRNAGPWLVVGIDSAKSQRAVLKTIAQNAGDVPTCFFIDHDGAAVDFEGDDTSPAAPGEKRVKQDPSLPLLTRLGRSVAYRVRAKFR